MWNETESKIRNTQSYKKIKLKKQGNKFEHTQKKNQ